ncbi:CASP-like protein 1E1 [Durio zibethinus]|uniref:CASP-like protein n=1 Tax=Durio zibethinus TaxID=66656 RepID=A0A6P5X5W4_DURZI|nr:CASP-like protein 1E1 [Durio zibethinus]
MESQSYNKVSTVDGSKGATGMSRTVSKCDLVLRVLAMLLTLAAAIVLGVNKQTKVVPIQITPTLPSINVAAQAKWQYLSAYVYFMVSNIIACSYAAISMPIVLGTRNGKMGLAQIIIVLDLVMVGLLFSGNGAAMAIGLMAYKGNSHVRWNEVCNVFDKFCDHAAVSLVLSLVGSLGFMALAAIAALTTHKRYAK